MLDSRKELDATLEECNNLEISLPVSAFANQIRKSCLEACEFLALGNSKKIFNNMTCIPYSKENIYVLSFDSQTVTWCKNKCSLPINTILLANLLKNEAMDSCRNHYLCCFYFFFSTSLIIFVLHKLQRECRNPQYILILTIIKLSLLPSKQETKMFLMQSIAIISGDCALFVPNMFMNRRRLRKSCKKQ